MKRCPECRRDYYDDSLLYCLDDGTALLEGPASGESQTQTLPPAAISPDPATRLMPAEPSSGKILVSGIRKHKFGTAVALIALLVIMAGFGYGLYSFFKGAGDQPRISNLPSTIKMQPLTADGHVREAAISPDGRFLAYTQEENGKAAVWTKQISTNSNVRITEPSQFDYLSLRFSPDGSYIYYTLFDNNVAATLYRVPALGGTALKTASNIDGQISFSPDGKQFVAERYDFNSTESSLLIFNSDGSGERKLASRLGHEYFSSPSLAWSPDGKLILCSTGDDTKVPPQDLAVVSIADGSVKTVGTQRFSGINNTIWFGDQSGFVFVASDQATNVPHQIWTASYPSGEVRRLTNDLMGYVHLSITADSKTLVAVQRESFGSIWFSNTGDVNKVEQISKGKHEGPWGTTMFPDGRVVYVSVASGATEVWIMNSDGSAAKQLTNDGISKYTPTVSSDGKYIVFVSERDGRHLWRMNADGSGMMQLTNGHDDGNPRFSPDGKWVVFDSFTSGKQILWRVSVDGGEPQPLTDFAALEADVSPDGKYIACFFVDNQANKAWRLAVIPFDGGPPVKVFDIPQTVAVDNSPVWTPDGKGITYIDWLSDISNLWVQPFDGGPAKQLTNYKQGYIYRREWSRDGKQVVIVRGSETSDAVMLTDFR